MFGCFIFYSFAVYFTERSGFMKAENAIKVRYVEKLSENLPVFRAKLGYTQQDLGDRIGVSRSTIALIENRKREMTWNTCLSLMYLFTHNEKTNQLLGVFGIITEELNSILFS